MISHDRYFLERTCDRVVGLLGDGKLTDLPRGIDQYLELREAQISASIPKQTSQKQVSSAAEERQIRKELTRIERQMEKLDSEIAELTRVQEASAYDAEKLIEATNNLESAKQRRATLEEEWLNNTLALED